MREGRPLRLGGTGDLRQTERQQMSLCQAAILGRETLRRSHMIPLLLLLYCKRCATLGNVGCSTCSLVRERSMASIARKVSRILTPFSAVGMIGVLQRGERFYSVFPLSQSLEEERLPTCCGTETSCAKGIAISRRSIESIERNLSSCVSAIT